jgi:DNA-binding beta-propeller fold protein YncE
MERKVFAGATLIAAALLPGIRVGSWMLDRKAVVQAAGIQAPRFEVDLMWPKPLPNHWLMGHPNGIAVDAQDHIWVVQNTGSLGPLDLHATTKPQIAECCAAAPPVLEFDQEGNVIKSWGGPGEGYDWPDMVHGIRVDYKGNVWIGSHGLDGIGPGGFDSNDHMVLKFTNDGKFLMQIGKPKSSKGNNDTANLRLPAKIFVDPKTNEAYIADGYGNHRVIVYDADTGKYKRHWGAYGHKPEDTVPGPYDPNAPPSQQFSTPLHCAELSNDNLVYVCDRENDRIQVFRPDGTFVREQFIEKNTLGAGSVWDIAFSRDPQQKFLYVADGENDHIHILNRSSLEELANFGEGGREPGEFLGLHSIATDSKGNIYTAGDLGSRYLQRFTYRGLASVRQKNQGVLWPKTTKRF